MPGGDGADPFYREVEGVVRMHASDFAARVRELSGEDLATLATALRQEHHSADADIAWWRATAAVSCTLRRAQRTRVAACAARAAADAVRGAAQRAGLTDGDRDAVTLVARAAADVARALVAVETRPTAAGALDQLLAPWAQLDRVA